MFVLHLAAIESEPLSLTVLLFSLSYTSPQLVTLRHISGLYSVLIKFLAPSLSESSAPSHSHSFSVSVTFKIHLLWVSFKVKSLSCSLMKYYISSLKVLHDDYSGGEAVWEYNCMFVVNQTRHNHKSPACPSLSF